MLAAGHEEGDAGCWGGGGRDGGVGCGGAWGMGHQFEFGNGVGGGGVGEGGGAEGGCWRVGIVGGGG